MAATTTRRGGRRNDRNASDNNSERNASENRPHSHRTNASNNVAAGMDFPNPDKQGKGKKRKGGHNNEEDHYSRMAREAEEYSRDKVLEEARAAVEEASRESTGRRKKRKEKREREAAKAQEERKIEEALAQGVNPEDLDAIKVSQGVTVQELAEALDVPANDIIKRLFLLGTPLTMTQSMSDDLVELVADDLGRQIKIITPEEENTFSFYDDPADLKPRAPVVTVMGHVDHGKTTLVDQMLKQAGAFRENQVVEERVMDSGDIERERGITILAKNTSVHYKGVKINIVDTPGHADFSGEVERILKMVDGVVLLVDAAEGPMPQTRFVLQKALEFGHKIIIAINKIDRPDARLNEIGDEVLELLLNLDATDEQLDSPIVYCSGRAGTASMSPNVEGKDLTPLFEQILEHIPAPHVDTEGPTQMLVSSIDYNEYVGRIGIGRIERGSMKVGQQVTVCDYHGNTKPYNAKLVTLYSIEELGRQPIEEAQAGEIVCFSGIEGVTIGETLCDPEHVEALPFVKISEPTVEMTFMVNDSPFAGKEGKFVTSRHLRERLFRELLKDVSLRVNETDTTDAFRVCGRGEMHLSILIENLRREGYEFQVGAPKALLKEIDGKTCEPMERMTQTFRPMQSARSWRRWALVRASWFP